jgi:hypothetical protein
VADQILRLSPKRKSRHLPPICRKSSPVLCFERSAVLRAASQFELSIGPLNRLMRRRDHGGVVKIGPGLESAGGRVP